MRARWPPSTRRWPPPAAAAAAASRRRPTRTTGRALAESGADLALISVPGQHAMVEAMDALDADRDVMIFSDNMPVEQEIALKDVATERGLLVMGPDCGTAMVGGLGLGFANTTRPGPVGIVAASGTGCQQLMCLLDAAGVGVGAALGVGGRDLGSQVAGRSTREALRRLDADPTIELVVVVSKPPADEVAAELRDLRRDPDDPGPLRAARRRAARPHRGGRGRARRARQPRSPTGPRGAAPPTRTSGTHLRGLFVGGTLCDEAMLIAAAELGGIRSNIPLSPELALDSSLTADAHTDDRLRRRHAHRRPGAPDDRPDAAPGAPGRAAADPATACILMDVVLGHGAEPDPAGALAPAITAAIETARAAGRELPVVIACVGTESDPQQLSRQARTLAEAGAEVHLSNARATRRAIALTGGTR